MSLTPEQRKKLAIAFPELADKLEQQTNIEELLKIVGEVEAQKGEKGDSIVGTPGKDGEDGYTPIKNVDYFDGEDGKTPTPRELVNLISPIVEKEIGRINVVIKVI